MSSFSDKMRDSLGAEGARLEVNVVEGRVPPGTKVLATVTVVGGNRDARVEALMVRLIEARRHWQAEDGSAVSEDQAQALEDRSHLTAGWDRKTIGESRIKVGHDLGAGERHDVEVEVALPEESAATSPACAYTLNVQADIHGQIDPTGNGKVDVG